MPGGRSGPRDLITLDMGGTSADVSLVRDLRADVALERAVAGLPIRLPSIDVQTVGAGGGSIAWFDRDGLLKVGPESAGADPGPACYGRGGTSPTVTDANLLLGRLSGRGLLGGRMTLDRDRAARAFAGIAGELGYQVERAAHGTIGVVVANMVRAIRTISVERGHDPRDFTLVAFGGAGPLHARDVAAALGIRELLVPEVPGIVCAQGLVIADLKEDFVLGRRVELRPDTAGELAAAMAELVRRARTWFEEEVIPEADREVELDFDARYVGQNFELRVPVASGPPAALDGRPAPDAIAAIKARFFEVHDVAYGYHNPDDPVEVVNVRLTAFGRTRRGAAEGRARGAPEPPAPVEVRPVWFDPHAPDDTPVFDRTRLSIRGRDRGTRDHGAARRDHRRAPRRPRPGGRAFEPRHHPRRSMMQMTVTVPSTPPAPPTPSAPSADAPSAGFELDAVGLEILSNALRSITDECFFALMKSAYSTNIKERRDHSASIMDVRGRLVAQSEQSLPLHIASMSGLMESVLAKFGDDLHDGDLFVANDPYVAGGTHLPDVNLALPVFSGGTLVGFVCNIAHHADIGGMAPGSMAGGMTEIFQEGLRIPVVRLFRRGELQQDLLDLLLLNVRVPHERRGDYFAQIAACRLGARRLLELVETRGAGTVMRGFDLMMERAERRLRDAVATIPDGAYEFEDRLDSDGTDHFDLPIRVRIEVAGERIRFDFAGTSEQVPGNMNTTVNATHASACYALKALLDPDIPNSQGVLDVAEVSAPAGTIVNAVFPASVAARANTCQRIVDVIFGALAKALSDRVPAAANGANTTAVFAGTNPDTGVPYVYLETLGEGWARVRTATARTRCRST